MLLNMEPDHPADERRAKAACRFSELVASRRPALAAQKAGEFDAVGHPSLT